MSIEFNDRSDALRHITLTGRLDIAGTDAIATKLAALAAGAQRRVVLDLTGVSFLASIGIRALISTAKAQQSRGGKVVLLVGTNEAVIKTLETTGIDALIPMFTDDDQAVAAAMA